MEHGWDAVTLDAIAQNVGVTKPALYSYFKNREALLREVTLEVVRNIQAGLGTTLAHDNDIHRIIWDFAQSALRATETLCEYLLPVAHPAAPGSKKP